MIPTTDPSKNGKPTPDPSQEGKPTPTPSQEGKISLTDASQFPIVGIGASAGGLEALEGFFSTMPADSHIAFVVIQHLSPTHKSIMGSLLQKHTAMQVFEIEDGMKVDPNCIYLNPPDKIVSIMERKLYLMPPVKIQGANLPIDGFLRSLADDQHEKAICIILSGTGSDGTLGLRAIKGAGGMTMAQEEGQARYDGMPRSAIDTGLVDFILPVEQMPAELLRYAQHPYVSKSEAVTHNEQEFRKIHLLIRSQTGHDFSRYKQTTIRRRVERRMAVHQITKLADYVRYLQLTPAEVDTLFKDMLIGVTNFFRDPEAFDSLQQKALSALIQEKFPDSVLRVWVPGCATGEEAYSLAILLVETMQRLKKRIPIQIFASDLDAAAIEYARVGLYPDNITADVSEARLRRFFMRENGSYKVKKEIRDLVVFAPQNLIKDPPFSRLNLISCRNVLIYMNAELQKKLIPLFHYTLLSGGFLTLGTSESIGEFTDLFAPLDAKWKIYTRKDAVSKIVVPYPGQPATVQAHSVETVPPKQVVSEADIQRRAERLVLEKFAPPALLVNDRAEILYFIGHVDHYLAFPLWEPSFNLAQIAHEDLRYKLSAALHRAFKQRHDEICEGLQIGQEGHYRRVDIVVMPLLEASFPDGYALVVFREPSPAEQPVIGPQEPASADEASDPRVISLEQELQSTKEYLQTTIEELETSNEELKSTNEELQSVNEELQSTNEELETSKEELQSTNEELTTVNSELQHKVEDLSQANNDINNLLASTNIGTIFLGTDLKIKRFTPTIAEIFNLIPSDVGRPISDITSNIKYDNLYNDAKVVLDTLAQKEIEVRNDKGSVYAMRMAPYRTLDNIIDGVVLTFVDISEVKQAQAAQQAARIYAENLVEAMRDPLLVLDVDYRVQSANTAFYRTFQVRPEDTEKRRIYELGNGQWDIPQLRDLLETIISRNDSFDDYEMEHDFPTIGRKKMQLNARRIKQTGEQPALILLIIEDVTAKESPM